VFTRYLDLRFKKDERERMSSEQEMRTKFLLRFEMDIRRPRGKDNIRYVLREPGSENAN